MKKQKFIQNLENDKQTHPYKNEGKMHEIEHIEPNNNSDFDITPKNTKKINENMNRIENFPKEHHDAPFIMTIEVEEGKTDKIYVKFDSNSEELAFDFCKRNNLDFGSLKFLTEEIEKLIIKLHEKKEIIRSENCIEELQEEEDKNSEYKPMNTEKTNLDNFVVETTEMNQNPGYINKMFENKMNKEIFEDDFKLKTNETYEKKSEKNITENINTENRYNNKDEISYIRNNMKTQLTQESANNSNTLMSNHKLYEYQLYEKQKLKTNKSKVNVNVSGNKENIFDRLYQESKFRRNKKMSMEEGNMSPNSRCLSPTQTQANLNILINNTNNIYNTVNKITPSLRSNFSGSNLLNNVNSSKSIKINDDTKRKVSLKKNDCKEKIITLKQNLTQQNKEKTFDNSKHSRHYSDISSFNHNLNIKTRDRNHELYEMAKLKTKRIEENTNEYYRTQFNFSPDIGKKERSKEKFLDRQEQFEKKKSEKILKFKEEVHKPFDKNTGQRLFSPIITNYKNNISNSRNKGEIFDYLHSEGKNKRLSTENIENSNNEQLRLQSNTIHTLNSTQFLYNQNKISQFKKIFRLLDQDEDGFITHFNVSIKNLPEKLRESINPILILLKHDQIKLDQDGFIKECEYLFNSMAFLEKKVFLNFEKFYTEKPTEFVVKILTSNRFSR